MGKPLTKQWRSLSWIALCGALALSACGGGGDGAPAPSTPAAPQAPASTVADPSAPALTGDIAADGVNRFNFRRQQAGLAAVARNAQIDTAASAHTNYQVANNVTTHVEEQGKPGFTGVQLGDRLRAAGYPLPASGYAYGEVISTRSDAQGAAAAEDLIGAIYHRFIILQPMYKEIGAGAATAGTGLTYFTADFAAIGLDRGLPRGGVVVYPFAGQANVSTSVFSDNETPDPVPGQNQVGYPVSVEANLTSTLTVQSFTVSPHGGAALAARVLSSAVDAETPASAAAAIPLAPLAPATTYDVQFIGAVDGVAVTRSWSFTTQ